MSVLMTLSDLERRDARVTFFRRIYLITIEPFDLAAEHMEGTFSMVSGTPHCKGAVPQCCPILGVTFYFCVHPLTPSYQI